MQSRKSQTAATAAASVSSKAPISWLHQGNMAEREPLYSGFFSGFAGRRFHIAQDLGPLLNENGDSPALWLGAQLGTRTRRHDGGDSGRPEVCPVSQQLRQIRTDQVTAIVQLERCIG